MNEIKQKILAVLRAKNGYRVATGKIAKTVGVEKGRALRALRQLQKENEVLREAPLRNYFGSLDAEWKYNIWREDA